MFQSRSLGGRAWGHSRSDEDKSQAPTPAREATPEYEPRPSRRLEPTEEQLQSLLEADGDTASTVSSHLDGPERALQGIQRLMSRRKFPYDAMQSHMQFGLTFVEHDLTGACVLLLHVPRCNGHYIIDVRPGDQLQTITRDMEHAYLDVLFVTPHKYYPPGRRVTTALIGVPAHQWPVKIPESSVWDARSL
jgi:hypothetical protein